jgi:uncharacterized membrane protein
VDDHIHPAFYFLAGLMEFIELPKNKPLVWVGLTLLVLLFCCCCLIVTLATVVPVLSSGKMF